MLKLRPSRAVFGAFDLAVDAGAVLQSGQQAVDA